MSGITANDKVYDATVSAKLNTGTAALVTPIDGDKITLNTTAVAASFDTKMVGTSKPVSVTGLTLDGADAANYTLAQPSDLKANITPKDITVTGLTVNSKTYDGTGTATLNLANAALHGTFSGDVVSLDTTSYTAAFSDKNAANNKNVNVSGLKLSGADASNYNLAQPTGITGNITPLTITASITAENKVYDGNNSATIATRKVIDEICAPSATIALPPLISIYIVKRRTLATSRK